MKNVILSTGIFLAIFRSAIAIRCYTCNSSDTSNPFQCGEWFDRYDKPDSETNDCSSVHGAQYCIKHIGRFEGGIGAIRYCSSKDLGNYCDYVQNKGDQMEYRSCIFTCDSDGCNESTAVRHSIYVLALLAAIAVFIKYF